jgi:hypothetical protein
MILNEELARMCERTLWFLLSLIATVLLGLPGARGAEVHRYQATPGMFASDCSVPVDQAITKWIASIPDNSIVSFAAGACYGLDGSIQVQNKSNLSFHGNGATFKAITLNTPGRSNWIVTGGTHIVFKRMTIVGFNPNPGGYPVNVNGQSYEFQAGILFRSVETARVEQVDISAVYGDFIDTYFDSPAMTPTRNLIVQNSHFDGSGRQGIALTDVDGVVLSNLYVGNTGLSGVDVEPDDNAEFGRNIFIVNNAFGPLGRFTDATKYDASVFSIGGHGYEGNVGNMTFSGNTQVSPLPPQPCVAVNVQPPSGVYWSGFTVTNNGFRSSGIVVELVRARDAKIASNNLVQYGTRCAKTGDAAVFLSDSHGVSVTDNNFAGEPNLIQYDPYGPPSTGVIVRNNIP